MKRVIICLIAALSVPAVAWITGFNFDARGETAGAIFAMSLFIFMLMLTTLTNSKKD